MELDIIKLYQVLRLPLDSSRRTWVADIHNHQFVATQPDMAMKYAKPPYDATHNDTNIMESWYITVKPLV